MMYLDGRGVPYDVAAAEEWSRAQPSNIIPRRYVNFADCILKVCRQGRSVDGSLMASGLS